MTNKKIHIIGGGTVSHIRSHLALSAPAYGKTARMFADACQKSETKLDVKLHLTRMAGGETLETSEDVAKLVDEIVSDETTKIVFFNPALVDFEPIALRARASSFFKDEMNFGKHADRLHTSDGSYELLMAPSKKIVKTIRKTRKDIFLIAFKTTTGATEQEQFLAGLKLLKDSSCNLVLANDTVTRMNMIITPEESTYHVTNNREEAIEGLVSMALLRSHLTFTRSTIISGDSVPWTNERVPSALRTVVDHCIKQGAYKPFQGATVGHFAAKLDDTTFLTSKRKTNFNDLAKNGLVLVKTDGPDSVIAHGAKPSVGGQSQRIIFNDHPEYDCIVHFHCPMRLTCRSVDIPVRSQKEVECGSHECGKNTSSGLKRFGNLSAVFLDKHGPNIVFHHSIDPQEVIDFIEDNFDLSEKTGGYSL